MRAAVLFVVALVACSSSTSGPPNQSPTLFYVSNTGSSTITAYAVGDTANVTPKFTIGGTNAGLDQPQGLVVDPVGIVLVTSLNPPRVLVFAAHAVGDIAPIATIAGSNTGLVQPKGIALDASGRLYVADAGSNSIRIFGNGASGNVAPAGTIAGTNTALSGPAGICFDLRGRLYVANSSGNTITIYDARATGNIRPTDTIAGISTSLNAPLGISLDPGGRLYVANSGTVAASSSITVYAAMAKGNAVPIDTIAGSTTQLDQPQGIELDAASRIYVVNSAFSSNQYRITVYAAGSSGNIAPVATLAGINTGLSAPAYLSF
jgi:hypothetical protein